VFILYSTPFKRLNLTRNFYGIMARTTSEMNIFSNVPVVNEEIKFSLRNKTSNLKLVLELHEL
jgi:hypothetical protein